MNNIYLNLVLSNGVDNIILNTYPILIEITGEINDEETLKNIIINEPDLQKYINESLRTLAQWDWAMLYCRYEDIKVDIKALDCIPMELPRVRCVIRNIIDVKDGPIMTDQPQDSVYISRKLNAEAKKKIQKFCDKFNVEKYYKEFYDKVADRVKDEAESI